MCQWSSIVWRRWLGNWGPSWLSWMPGWRRSAPSPPFPYMDPRMLSPAGEGVYEMTSGGSETPIRHLPEAVRQVRSPLAAARSPSGQKLEVFGDSGKLCRKIQEIQQRRTVPQFPRERGRFHQPFRFRDCSCLSLIGAAWSKQTHSPYWKLGQRAEVRRLQKRCQIPSVMLGSTQSPHYSILIR